MISSARMYVWWLELDSDIEKSFLGCEEYQSMQPPPLWPLCVCGNGPPNHGQDFIWIWQAHSLYIGGHSLGFLMPTRSFLYSSASSAAVIEELRPVFAHAVWTPWNSCDQNWLLFYDRRVSPILMAEWLKHIISAPYHPALVLQRERYIF